MPRILSASTAESCILLMALVWFRIRYRIICRLSHVPFLLYRFTSNQEFQCPNAGFAWAKEQALAYSHEGDLVGEWYEAALPDRQAFCMRDVAHHANDGNGRTHSQRLNAPHLVRQHRGILYGGLMVEKGKIEFVTSDAAWNAGFAWAKEQALA